MTNWRWQKKLQKILSTVELDYWRMCFWKLCSESFISDLPFWALVWMGFFFFFFFFVGVLNAEILVSVASSLMLLCVPQVNLSAGWPWITSSGHTIRWPSSWATTAPLRATPPHWCMSQLPTSMTTGRISHSASMGRNYPSRYVESGPATFVLFLVTGFEHHLVVKSMNLPSQSWCANAYISRFRLVHMS